MSEIVLAASDIEAFVRARAETVLVGAATKTDYSLHLPKPNEPLQSICRFGSQRDGYREKPIDAYPTGHAPKGFCTECVERTFDVEVIDNE